MILNYPTNFGKSRGREGEVYIFHYLPATVSVFIVIFYLMGSKLRGLALLNLQRDAPCIMQGVSIFLDQHLLHYHQVDVVDSADITIGLWAHVPRLNLVRIPVWPQWLLKEANTVCPLSVVGIELCSQLFSNCLVRLSRHQ